MASTLTTIPLTGAIKLLVRLGYGSIRIETRDDLTEAAVHLIPRDAAADVLQRINVELHDGTLSVAAPHQRRLADVLRSSGRERDAVDAILDVPTGTPLTIAADSEEITITGRCGQADIATGAARLTLETVDGDLRLRNGAGDVSVATVHGSVRLAAGSGAAHFGGVDGRIECRFGSGELTIDEARGELRCRSGAGAADVGCAYGDVDIALGAGPVTIGLPSGVSAHLDLVSGTGQVASDLPLETKPAAVRRSINVRARTGSGEIRLCRAAAAA